jgi:hypothetical protein
MAVVQRYQVLFHFIDKLNKYACVTKLKRRNPNIERSAAFGTCYTVRRFVFSTDDNICNYLGKTRKGKITRLTTKGEQV